MELRSLVGDWRASLDDVLARTLGDDEAAKFAVAGNLGYYADDPRDMWWPFFALAQGAFLNVGGVFIKGGSRMLSMKLAKVVTKAGGSVLLGREAVGIDIDAQRPPGLRALHRSEGAGSGRARRREKRARQLRARRFGAPARHAAARRR